MSFSYIVIIVLKLLHTGFYCAPRDESGEMFQSRMRSHTRLMSAALIEPRRGGKRERVKPRYETGEQRDSERLSNSSFVDPYTNVFCDYLSTLSCSVPFLDSACSGFRIHA